MDHFQGKKPKTEEVTGVSRSGRVRKKSSKLMDFESPDEIDKNYKKHGAAAMRKIEPFDGQPPRKAGRSDEMMYPRPDFENFDMLAAAAGAGPPLGTGEPHSGSEFDESEYDLPAHTESSMDSADNSDNNNSDFDENTEHGVFKRLDTDTSKKRLIIKDGRIMKTDKGSGKKGRDHADGSPPKFKPINVNRGGGRTTGKKTPTAKNSPGGGGGGGSSVHHAFDNTSGMISPPNSRNKGVGSGGAPDYKVSGIRPIDVAAHLKLLGESLTIIGERLKEHEGQIAVSGSLSVLLDSLLCALGPLLCLTQQVPELRENCCTPEQLMSTLDNVAFIMPGL